MQRPRLLAVIALTITAIAVIAFLLRPDQSPPAPPSPPHQNLQSSVAPPPAPPRPATITRLPVAESAATLNSPDTTADEDLATIDLLLSQYRRHFGGNPVGDNAEITAALLGRNPKGLAYLPAEGPFLDPEGLLIDRWGSPYFFHALSGTHMEIHSAGPDKKLHTPDDLRHQP